MERNKFFVILIGIVVFITNISQTPYVVDTGFTQLISFPAWIALVFYLLLLKKIEFKRMELIIIFLGIIFLFGVMFSELFTEFNHLSSNLIVPFYLSIFIFFVGLFSATIINKNDIVTISKFYIFSMLIVSLNIFVVYFSNGIDWFSKGYVYGSKNSISQMILTALIFIFMISLTGKTKVPLINWLMAGFFLFLMLALKSRASILGLLVSVLIILFYFKVSPKVKIIMYIFILSSTILLMINHDLRLIIFEGVLLGGRDFNSLEDVSSGRLSQITEDFPYLIAGNELLGTGTFYVESFILNAILKHGILFGWILILIAMWPIYWGMRYLNKNDTINIAFIMIAVTYFINGYFEAQAPFGPGSKNYMLWLMFGLLYGLKRKVTDNKNGGILF